MISRMLLPLFFLLFAACAPVIKPAAVSPTDTAQATGVPTKTQVTPSPAPHNTMAKVTAYQSLHVRVRPGEHATVAGYLYHGNTVTLTNRCKDGWAQIEWQSGTAWVKARFLSNNKCQTKEGE